MKSKLIYTALEADEIIQLIEQKLKADTQTQKGIRAKIRNRGFWASEFGFRDGYTVADFLSVAKIEGELPVISTPPPSRRTMSITKPATRKANQSDETYIIDLCDEILGQKALRQHRFDFLRGDAGTKLPVDAYYPKLNLVIEYRERQHTEAVKFFDKRETVSGMGRGEQRKKYDQLRRDLIPQHGMKLIELGYDNFEHNGSKRLSRNRENDLVVLTKDFNQYI